MALFAEVEHEPTGSAANVEYTAPDMFHSVAFHLPPLVVLGVVQLRTGAGGEGPVVSFDDLPCLAPIEVIEDRLAVRVFVGF
jgi:hypothetical protein